MSIFKNKYFKGQKYIDRDGYVMVRMPVDEKPLFHPMYGARGYGFEHRINMAKKIGRPLTVDETVHHIDKNRQNNQIDNLEIIKRNYHHKHHISHGDYKLFSKDYQPRWQNKMKKQAMDKKIVRMLSTLGGAVLGGVPGYLAYNKSKKIDKPEEIKGAKRRALEQVAGGTLLGGFAGYTAAPFLSNWKDPKNIEALYKNKTPGFDLSGGDVSTGFAIGALGSGLLAKNVDPKSKYSDLKRGLLSSFGTGAGIVMGKLNKLTR